jgi:hypothetical protein
MQQRETRGSDVMRFALAWIALALIPSTPLWAQTAQAPNIDDIKGKILAAQMAQKSFPNELKFCNELDGKNFYFAPRGRVVSLEDYHRSVESLAKSQAFNPQTKKPWSDQDAADLWAAAQKDAIQDKMICNLVSSLPQLQKQLEEVEKKKPEATTGKN